MFDTCSSNVTNPERINNNGKHSGSTLLTFDVDSNNTKDLVLGDVSYDNFILLTNNDTSTNFTSSSITVQDTAFPANNVNSIATHLPLFPAGFYLDVNNDGIKDLIASPNCYVGCKNSNNVWYYKNTNANNKPNFNLVTTGFLQEGMIDVGEGSHPVFFDYNADGLLDIVVGNHYEFDLTTSTGYKSSLYLYTGSQGQAIQQR